MSLASCSSVKFRLRLMLRPTSLSKVLLFLLLTLTPHCVGGDDRSSLLDTRKAQIREYCENEIFRAACGSDEVIIVQSAHYGRMRISKCIDRDYGYVGCSADVLPQADRLCSGRRKCEANVPNPLFSSDAVRCPRDLKPYLEVAFDCLKVEAPRHRSCSARQIQLEAGAQQKIIPSILTEETGLGSADCPWLIRAPLGQKVNLTLHDYGLADKQGDACHAYAIIRERNPPRSVTICNGLVRVRPAYTSVSNEVEIRILKSQKSERGRYFLLQYQAVGCADLPVSSGTWMKRSTDGAKAVIGCKSSDESWTVKCDKNKWVGRTENCTQVAVGAIHSREWGIVSLPFGLSVIIVITIALTIGIIFMIIGLACLRWRRQRELERVQKAKKENPYYTGFVPPHPKSPDRRHLTRELPWPPPPSSSADQEALYTSENEYSYIAEVPLPPPPPPVGSGNNSTLGTHAHNDARDRELPDPPKYFVLEPNGTESVTSRESSSPPVDQRYIGVDHSVAHHNHSLGNRKSKYNNTGALPDGDIFLPQPGGGGGNFGSARRSHQGAPYPDMRDFHNGDRGHNHVSV